jgi:hypothetical protein
MQTTTPFAATTGAPSGIGAAAPAMGGSLSGVLGPLANLIGGFAGGGNIQAGFGDIEKGLQTGIGTQQQFLQQALGQLSPFRTAGVTGIQGALAALQQEHDPTGFVNQILSQFQQSPAQQAGIQSGLTAVQNRLQAQGLGQSGAEQKELEQFAQQQTGQQQQQFLQNVLGLQQQRISGLSGIGGMGLQAAGQGAQGILGTGANISQLQAAIGQAKAQAEAARAAQKQQEIAGGLGLASGIGSLIIGGPAGLL